MKKHKLINSERIDQYQPMNFCAWQLKNGSYHLMAGNLEEGINHRSDKSVYATINLPVAGIHTASREVVEIWNGEKLIIGNNTLAISLSQAQTKLFTFN